MTADAISFEHGSAMGGNYDLVRHCSRMENEYVFHPIYGFPDVVDRRIFVGKVTFDASESTMCAVMQIGGVLRLHYMTAGAESR